ncbi:MAG: ABC transporter permease subunit [Abitibacteriaceae bacterium]|nr:ABC transporter permease subunit [Abditibacteriaceae bacterium]
MQLNPILTRDMRARWRGWRAFGLVFVYATLLALLMWWQYKNLFASPTFANDTDPRQRMAFMGNSLFRGLTTIQIFGWMLLAPALTATSIAGEREQGLLESLQLSSLSPWRILMGKLLSVVAFLVLMLLIPLPITAVCFMLGGVSPGEFALALGLQIVTALTCSLLGLAASAWSQRANVALGKSFIYTLIWSVGTIVVADNLGGPIGLLKLTSPLFLAQQMSELYGTVIQLSGPGSSLISGPGSVTTVIQTTGGFALLNNSILSYGPITIASRSFPLSLSSSIINSTGAVWRTPWAICIGFQAALSLLLLLLAVRGIRKSLDAQYWIERKSWIEKLKRYIPQPDPNAEVPQDSTQRLKQKTRQALWWEFPAISWLRFANPILQREVRNKLRLRWAEWKGGLIRLCLACGFLYYYINWLATAIFFVQLRARIAWQMAYFTLGAIVITSAVLGASAITREREAGTWEGLGLSLLSPRKILTGKLISLLFSCLLYSLPLWLLMLGCTNFDLGLKNSAAFNAVDSLSGGVMIFNTLSALLIIGATAWGCMAWAMLISWRYRRTPVAVGWTLGFYLALFILLPAFLSYTRDTSIPSTGRYLNVYSYPATITISPGLSSNWGSWQSSSSMSLEFNPETLVFWRWVHPVLALGYLSNYSRVDYWRSSAVQSDPVTDGLIPAIALSTLWLIFGFIPLGVLHYLMRDNPRERDWKQREGWLYTPL